VSAGDYLVEGRLKPSKAIHEYYLTRIPAGLSGYPPLGLLIVLLSLAPLALNIRARIRAHGWHASGRCRACGYDRRELPPRTPSPECGTLPTPLFREGHYEQGPNPTSI
jgi:hypothetical protein